MQLVATLELRFVSPLTKATKWSAAAIGLLFKSIPINYAQMKMTSNETFKCGLTGRMSN